jgi:hypothetical protein
MKCWYSFCTVPVMDHPPEEIGGKLWYKTMFAK